jgi:hypothetical protein
MTLGPCAGAIVRVGASLVGAGVFHLPWMAVFILTARSVSSGVRLAEWLVAPLVTSAGFALGALLADRLTTTRRVPFWRVLLWPLSGCVVGAGIGCMIGPMLIGFGMFLLGAASMTLRELVLWNRDRNLPPGP